MKLPIPWLRRKSEDQTGDSGDGASRVDPSRAGEAIAASRAGHDVVTGRYVELWADTVMAHAQIELLAGTQNVVVFGAANGGRQAVLFRVINIINSRFMTTRHAAVYVNLTDLASTSTVYTWTSIEGLYRGLVMAPLVWGKTQWRLKTDRKLAQIEADLEEHIGVQAARLDLMKVRAAVYAWMDRLGIQHLSLFMDDVSGLSAELTPVLLRMALDTFPRGSRVTLKLGGSKESFKLQERSKKDGVVGLQLNHDVLIGFDLEELLHARPIAPEAEKTPAQAEAGPAPEHNDESQEPRDGADAQASVIDPRQVFLARCVHRIMPAIGAQLGLETAPQWEKLFGARNGWFDIFELAGFDVQLIGETMEQLLREGAQFDRAKVEQAIADVKAIRSGKLSLPERRAEQPVDPSTVKFKWVGEVSDVD